MENIPFYVNAVFILTSLVTVFLFYGASRRSTMVLLAITGWILLQSIVSLKGFYAVTASAPPRFVLLVLPPFLLIMVLFSTRSGRNFIDGLDPKPLLLLHIVRIPVEFVLLFLFLHKVVPQVMTFEGRNWDILSGLSAPVVYYFYFIRHSISKKFLLFWNVVCLLLLVNIVVIAVLSAPFAFQRLAFEQPNVAVLYFPFTLLPGCVVPLVMFSHLATIRQLFRDMQFSRALVS